MNAKPFAVFRIYYSFQETAVMAVEARAQAQAVLLFVLGNCCKERRAATERFG
jgi:hypothetical protein